MAGKSKERRPMTPGEQDKALANLSGAKWYYKRLRRQWPVIPRDDLWSLCLTALCRAAQEHDPERGRFMTCLDWQVRYHVLAWRREQRPAGFKQIGKYPDVPETFGVGPDWFALHAAS